MSLQILNDYVYVCHNRPTHMWNKDPVQTAVNIFMSRPFRIVLQVSLAMVFVGVAYSQTQVQQQHMPIQNTPASPQTLRVITRLVQVNVIVEDKDGRPVTGLVKNDFAIFDNGQPQQISSFAELTNRSEVTVASEATPGLFSNRLQQLSGGPGAAIVILLDFVNSHSGDMGQARRQVAKFIQAMRPQDQVAIYGVSFKGTFVLHDFTSDRDALLRALGLSLSKKTDATGVTPSDFWATGDKTTDAFIAEASARTAIPAYAADSSGQISAGMKAIAKIMAKLPGRKTLFWVTAGFPYRAVGRSGQAVSSAAQAMNDANVAVYSVDARGLIAGDPLHAGLPLPPLDVDAMTVLSSDTGGRAFFNTNDISFSIERAVEGSSTSYLLSYYPSHNRWDGQFREISVKVAQSGVKLRYRGGYFASAGSGASSTDSRQSMSAALRSLLQFTDLGFDAHLTGVRNTAAHELRAEIHVDSGQMKFERKDGRWTDSVEVVWEEFDATDRLVGRGGTIVKLKSSDFEHVDFLQHGFSFTEHISLKNEAVELRLVIRDDGSSSIGSLNIPLTAALKDAPAKPSTN